MEKKLVTIKSVELLVHFEFIDSDGDGRTTEKLNEGNEIKKITLENSDVDIIDIMDENLIFEIEKKL